MSARVSISADKQRGAGHALVRIEGIGPAPGPLRFRLRRLDHERAVLGAAGWQVADALLEPMEVRREDGATVLVLGPAVCEHVEEGGVEFSLPAAGISESVFWPEIAPLYAGSRQQLPTGVGRPEDVRRSRRGFSPTRVAQPEPPPPTTRAPEPTPVAAAPQPTAPVSASAEDETVLIAPAAQSEAPQPVVGKQRRRWQIPAALLLSIVALGAGGYAAWHRPARPPPVPDHSAPPATDLSRLSVAEIVARNNPAEMLAEAERRAGTDRAGDALLLREEAADRHYPPAYMILAKFYDPLQPRSRGARPDPRRAAQYYRYAVQSGDQAAETSRAALQNWLQAQAGGNPLSNEALILKDFWP